MFIYGSHAWHWHQQQIIAAEQIFSASGLASTVTPPGAQPPTVAHWTLWYTHAAAVMQNQIVQTCQVFNSANDVPFTIVVPGRDFVIADAEQPWPPNPSYVIQNGALFPQVIVGQRPLFSLIMANQPQFPLDRAVSSTFFPLIPPPPQVLYFLVKAVRIGWAEDYFTGLPVLRAPGDIFYIASNLFADATIDYSGGNPGGPQWGWMTQVPPTTPITNPSHGGVPFYDFQEPGRRTVY